MKKYYLNKIHNIVPIYGNWIFSHSKEPVFGLMLATLEDLKTSNETKKVLIPFTKNRLGMNTYSQLVDLEELDIELKD